MHMCNTKSKVLFKNEIKSVISDSPAQRPQTCETL